MNGVLNNDDYILYYLERRDHKGWLRTNNLSCVFCQEALWYIWFELDEDCHQM